MFTFDEINRVDFSDPNERRTDINGFVKKHTEESIEELLSINSMKNRKNVILVNAAIFKGFLKNRFDSKVELETFHGVNERLVEMMWSTHTLKHG